VRIRLTLEITRGKREPEAAEVPVVLDLSGAQVEHAADPYLDEAANRGRRPVGFTAR